MLLVCVTIKSILVKIGKNRRSNKLGREEHGHIKEESEQQQQQEVEFTLQPTCHQFSDLRSTM